MRKRLAYACAVSALTTTLAAQQPLVETIEVRVRNVEVVVTDRAGKPITGLTKGDFELYENRKPQTITNFYEIVADAPEPAAAATTTTTEDGRRSTVIPTEMRQRSIVVFIDNSSIEPVRRNQAIDATWTAVDKLVRRGDDAMVVAWDHHTQILQPFTTDTSAIKRALDGVRRTTAAASTIVYQRNEVMSYANEMYAEARDRRAMMTPAQAYGLATGKARSYAEWVRSTQTHMLDALSQTASMLSGIDGRKVLIFVGGEMQERPGMDVFQMVDSLFLTIIRNITPAQVRETDLNTTFDLDKVARAANANGVTLYMINVADRGRSAEEGSMQQPPDPEIEFTRESNTYMSMAKLASDTGGTVLNGSTNYNVLLDTINRDLGSYYSLGYKPSPNGGTDRSITVRVKRPGAYVRARHTYTMKTPDEEMHDRVIANAFHTTVKSDFPVKIETSAPEPFENGLVRVKVTLSFPGDLTYLPDGKDLAGAYQVFFVTAGDDGALSPLAKQENSVRFPSAALSEIKQRTFTHGAALIVKPGTKIVSAAVVDKLGGRAGFARASLSAP